jgi:putative tryptophan/tyrosine transport system substrate-binding protein
MLKDLLAAALVMAGILGVAWMIMRFGELKPYMKLFWLLTVLFLASSHLAEAQQPKNVPRIGYLLEGSSSSAADRVDTFRDGLRDLGYVEGKNIVIDYRYAEGKFDRFPELAAELVRLKVYVIVAVSTVAARAAQNATRTIPIVALSGDPVETGLVASLARPGGNVTGLASLAPELSTKRLELLKEIVSKVSLVAVLWNPNGPAPVLAFKETQLAAKRLGLLLQSLEVRGPDDFESAFGGAIRERASALLVISDPLTNTHQRRIVELAAKNRLPAIYPIREFVQAGGLMAYAPDRLEQYRRVAYYVDKILKGAKPADLPVEQPTKFEFVINLKAAKQIGLTIPPNVLARADKVIR